MKDLYKEEASLQILENLSILLKLVYPKMNDGSLPNMEDLLALLSNFDLVEKMCKILEKDEDLARKHQIEISYFQRAFFSNSSLRKDTEKVAFQIASRLENLLRAPKIRYILCNRHTNINFDDALANGEVTFICTRRGDSGKVAHKAFGLFFLLSMQNSVLSRPGSEKSRIPNFLYIDEFPDFLSKETETMFTMFRKYRVATTISAQSISQFALTTNKTNYNSVVLANCNNKVYTGGATPIEELNWWQKEIGTWKQWKITQSYDGKTGKMSSTMSNSVEYPDKMTWNRLQTLALNRCAYKLLAPNGYPQIGDGIMSYVSSKYKEKHSGKKYNFGAFSSDSSVHDDSDSNGSRKKYAFKSSSKKLDFKENGQINPVQNTETKYSFDKEEGAIVIDLKHDKK